MTDNSKNSKVITSYLSAFSKGIFFWLITVIVLPERYIFAAFLLIILTILLGFLPDSVQEGISDTPSVPDGDYELAKRRWKKEFRKMNNREENRTEQVPTVKKSRIVPPGFSLNTSSRILHIISRDEGKEKTHREVRLRLSRDWNDRIMETRIRSIFQQINSSSSREYSKGIDEIKRLLKLRSESLISSDSRSRLG